MSSCAGPCWSVCRYMLPGSGFQYLCCTILQDTHALSLEHQMAPILCIPPQIHRSRGSCRKTAQGPDQGSQWPGCSRAGGGWGEHTGRAWCMAAPPGGTMCGQQAIASRRTNAAYFVVSAGCCLSAKHPASGGGGRWGWIRYVHIRMNTRTRMRVCEYATHTRRIRDAYAYANTRMHEYAHSRTRIRVYMQTCRHCAPTCRYCAHTRLPEYSL